MLQVLKLCVLRYIQGKQRCHNMFGKRHKLKYEAVKDDDELREFDPFVKRKIVNSACLWSSLFTAGLIGTYYIPSIALTFYQRWFLQQFHYPLTTVLVHMTVKLFLACIVRAVMDRKLGKQRMMVSWKEYALAMGPMGLFGGLDIGFSNWGLELIKISLYTMTKSTTIVFILIFSILFKLEKKSWSLCTIVVMITVGLILFTYKSTQFDVLGFLLLLMASLSSGVRWTCVQMLLQKGKMGMRNPIDMIYHMQPWMIASVLPFALWIEGPRVIQNCQLLRYTDTDLVLNTTLKILLGAFVAFFMEVTEMMVISYTSSLTLSIAGIFKEVFVLVLAVVWNGDTMSPINFGGLLICLSGITLHVIHKLRSDPLLAKSPHAGRNAYEVESEELGEQLLENVPDIGLSSDSEDEKSDTQVLFDILNSHDR